MQTNDFNWKIGGEAGFGIMSSGLMFAKACSRAGLNIHDYSEYPSLIRGGHNTYQVYVSDKEIHSQRRLVNLLVALNSQTITEHLDELAKGSAIICDTERIELDKSAAAKQGVVIYDLPLNKIAKEVGGDEVMRNTVALGATMALVKHKFSFLEQVIKDQFADKEADVAKQNIKAAQAGWDYISKNYKVADFDFSLKAKTTARQILVTANDAMALGAVAAGCKFYAAYPMTPASSILHTLAKIGPEHGMVVRHAEDEISVINMVQGAANVGARSMIATSGGGFALMNEGYSLAGMTETPIVIVEVMRPGPATGLPTWTDQGDLKYVLSAGHGEWPRVVLAPGDQEEAFYLTQLAFNLSDIIQSPVIILSDKYISESHVSLPDFDTTKIPIKRGKILTDAEAKKQGEKYKRYALTDDGISPRALVGQVGPLVFINSDEHDEFGFSEESAESRIKQVDKRARKLEAIKDLLPKPKVYGPQQADITLVGWGSVKGPLLDAISSKDLTKRVNFLHFSCLTPLAEDSERLLKSCKKLVLVETNSQGQFGDVLRGQTGISFVDKILRYDGRPFYSKELVEQINRLS